MRIACKSAVRASSVIIRGILLLAILGGASHFAVALATDPVPSQPTVATATQPHVAESSSADNEVNVYRHSPMVHTLARMFGLSTETTARIFEVVNFLMLAVAVFWFVLRLLPKALCSRRERIQKDLQQARIATEDANRRLQDVEQRLARLDSEIGALQHQAEHETTADEARIRASMDEEKQRLVHAAEQEIQSVGANGQRRLKALAADLIVEYASQHVSLQVDEDRSLVSSFVAELDSKNRNGEGRNR